MNVLPSVVGRTVRDLPIAAGAVAALAALTAPLRPAAAQSAFGDRLEFHGALNAAYGRASDLAIFGVPKEGTSDYRVVTLQARYKLGERDAFVAQVFNRRLGTSPLAGAIPDVTMQWAFYQRRQGDFTFKAGRNPLPRGLMNEVRYIGTVLPFYRPPIEVQQEAFDAIDGAVVTYRRALGPVELEQHVFGGGSEFRAIATTANGPEVRLARTDNMFGGQTYLTLPVAGLRFGAYGARYEFRQRTGVGYRSNWVFSGESTIDRLKVQAELSRITGHGPANDNRGGYVLASYRLHDRLSVAGQRAWIDRKLYPTNLALSQMYPEVRTNGAAASIGLTSNAVLKFEHHWRRGYSFDTPVTVLSAQTPSAVTFAPPGRSRYFLASVAVAF